jgi:hypothetical protein
MLSLNARAVNPWVEGRRQKAGGRSADARAPAFRQRSGRHLASNHAIHHRLLYTNIHQPLSQLLARNTALKLAANSQSHTR